jgi:hypothetical protein
MISCDGLADVSQGRVSVKPDPIAAAWAPVDAGEAGVGVTFDDEHPAMANTAAANAAVRSVFTGSRLLLRTQACASATDALTVSTNRLAPPLPQSLSIAQPHRMRLATTSESAR